MEDILEYLDKEVTVKVDRPLGSIHPSFDLIYPVNYGYVDNTVGKDGEEIDAYLLGIFEPIHEYDGKVIAVLKRHDDEDKLIVCPHDKTYTKDQIKALVEFQERFFESEIIMNNED